MAVGPIETAILRLYIEAGELDQNELTQFLDVVDADQVRTTDVAPAITALQVAVGDQATKPERYAAVLVYVLTIQSGAHNDQQVSAALKDLGITILANWPTIPDPDASEDHLRVAVEDLINLGQVTQNVADEINTAFQPDASIVTNAGTQTFKIVGVATDVLLSIVHIAASAKLQCSVEPKTFVLDGKPVQVTELRQEWCVPMPFEKCKAAVDPRNWDDYSPLFFHSIQVLYGNPGPTGDWAGIIQEKVGLWNDPIVTNLNVTYIERQGTVVTAYDLTPDSVANLPADDQDVYVDHGMFAMYDEGGSTRVTVHKVFALTSATAPNHWLCPVWAKQLGFSPWNW